jgi:proteasome lid subunit RPN8/RPN11
MFLIVRAAVHLTPVLDAAFLKAQQFVRTAATVALTREQSQSITAGAAGASRESCGILLGHCANARIVVERIIRTRNFSRRSGSFMLSLASVAEAIERNPTEEFLGVYHSHADTTVPSRTDIRAMSATRCLWLIVAPQQVAAYRVVDCAVESLPVVEGG